MASLRQAVAVVVLAAMTAYIVDEGMAMVSLTNKIYHSPFSGGPAVTTIAVLPPASSSVLRIMRYQQRPAQQCRMFKLHCHRSPDRVGDYRLPRRPHPECFFATAPTAAGLVDQEDLVTQDASKLRRKRRSGCLPSRKRPGLTSTDQEKPVSQDAMEPMPEWNPPAGDSLSDFHWAPTMAASAAILVVAAECGIAIAIDPVVPLGPTSSAVGPYASTWRPCSMCCCPCLLSLGDTHGTMHVEPVHGSVNIHLWPMEIFLSNLCPTWWVPLPAAWGPQTPGVAQPFNISLCRPINSTRVWTRAPILLHGLLAILIRMLLLPSFSCILFYNFYQAAKLQSASRSSQFLRHRFGSEPPTGSGDGSLLPVSGFFNNIITSLAMQLHDAALDH